MDSRSSQTAPSPIFPSPHPTDIVVLGLAKDLFQVLLRLGKS
jgi:hypothetical protein